MDGKAVTDFTSVNGGKSRKKMARGQTWNGRDMEIQRISNI
jgi:hypothetical protein